MQEKLENSWAEILVTKNSAMKPEFYKNNAISKTHLIRGFIFPLAEQQHVIFVLSLSW